MTQFNSQKKKRKKKNMSTMRSILFIVIAQVCWLFAVLEARTLTAADVGNIQQDLIQTFGLTPSYGQPCNAKVAPCPLGDNIGALVRLAFHDAAGNGGANGCIDFKNTDANKGLEPVVDTLNQLYNSKNYQSIISKADLYVLAANTAIAFASTEPGAQVAGIALPQSSVDAIEPDVTPAVNPPPPPPNRPNAPNGGQGVPMDPTPGTLTLPFRYGRKDSLTCNDANALPSTNVDWSSIRDLFGGRFGMGIKEIVAIMGGHSLGRCEAANSGFDGGWTTTQSSFSNQYYKVFSGPNWRSPSPSADVWNDGRTQTILLKPDVELLFQSHGTGQFCSNFNSFTPTAACPLQSQTNKIFRAYATAPMGISYFFANFSTAWQKMTEFGFAQNVGTVDSPPVDNAYPFASEKPSSSPVTSLPIPTFSPTSVPLAARSRAPTRTGTAPVDPHPRPTMPGTNPNPADPEPSPMPDPKPKPKQHSGGPAISRKAVIGVAAGVGSVAVIGGAVGYSLFAHGAGVATVAPAVAVAV